MPRKRSGFPIISDRQARLWRTAEPPRISGLRTFKIREVEPGQSTSEIDTRLNGKLAARRSSLTAACPTFRPAAYCCGAAFFLALRPEDARSGESMVPQDHFWFEFETPRQTPAGEMAAFLIINRDDTDLLVETGPYMRSDWQWSREKKRI